MSEGSSKFTEREALRFHQYPRPGKLEIVATKPMATQRDLSLAYSPGVAVPVLAIHKEPDSIYDYTARGNLVAVITNGTAILGLGNLGAAAAKPVMEGKAVLFKRFADIDAIDIELATEDVDAFVAAVAPMEPSFGGINLEDIAAPACFLIEDALRERMKIPVFHDDQHGTAIITAAGFLNACLLTDRKPESVRVVMNGAGAASISCGRLLLALGVRPENLIMCDSKGVIYRGRAENMNQWKSSFAIETDCRTLADAMKGADMFVGLSVKGAVTAEMVRTMAENPIIFAMANPDPEISPEEVAGVRDDAIMATGRSDYPNQVNNVLGFPYIFRGALDVRATTVNEEMKLAAAHALAELARTPVPEEVSAAYSGRNQHFGKNYIIPSPFDPRLMEFVPPRVAKAAMDTGVARRPIADMDAYRRELSNRLNPTVGLLGRMFDMLRGQARRVVFAEGEEERALRAAIGFQSGGYGVPILVGYEEVVAAKLKALGADPAAFEIHSARSSDRNADYAERLYKRLQRQGYLKRDAQRLVNRDRNVFSAMMVVSGDADAMVTGLTRNYYQALENISLAVDPKPGVAPFGLTILLAKGRTVFVADTVMNERPSAAELADIAVNAAAAVRHLGHEPRAALLSFSNFGQPMREKADHVREAVSLLEKRGVDFEFEGEMAPDVALDADLLKLYPFARLSGPANLLVMPALHSANIACKLVGAIGGARVIGPILWGFEKSVQIVRMGSHTSDLINMAALAAIGSLGQD